MINKITIAASLSVLSHCASAVYMSASSNKWLGASNSLGNPHKTFIYHGATISLGQSMPVSKYVSAGLDIGYGHNLNHKNAFNNYDELQTHIKYSI